jgi:hypothetical protein
MWKSILERVAGSEHRDIALTAGGMLALVFGQKKSALGMFGAGVWGLEQQWRARHPEFVGGRRERWAQAVKFYEATHGHPVNRWLHIVGIPMIVGGAAGLLAFKPYRPLWFASAGSFTAGWALNFVGHGVFEKKAPAFKDDPLSFIAGPAWDLQQVFGQQVWGRIRKSRATEDSTASNTTSEAPEVESDRVPESQRRVASVRG